MPKEISKKLDAVLNGVAYEVKTGLKDVRTVRASLLELANHVAEQPSDLGLLLLEEPEISEDRLHQEWHWMERLLKPLIFERVGIALMDESHSIKWIPASLSVKPVDLEQVLEIAREKNPKKMRRPSEAHLEVLRVLLVQAYRGNQPVTAKWLGEACGYSHPTIATALDRMQEYLEPRSDKKNRLAVFPKSAWMKLLANADTIRNTRRYVDRTGNPRSQEVLLGRLKEEKDRRVAVAGVLGARHWMPDLDLTGAPRLELIVHEDQRTHYSQFIRRLDPGLEEAEPGEAAQVILHSLYRKNPLFSDQEDGLYWADPVECILDLYGARLESQADAMLQILAGRCKR